MTAGSVGPVFKSVRRIGGSDVRRFREMESAPEGTSRTVGRRGKAIDREVRDRATGIVIVGLTLFLLGVLAGLSPGTATAGEIVFLQDGRTIQAEKTEIIGDRVRIEKPAETIELPRASVLSIHRRSPPIASPAVPPPAEVYRDLTQQMTDKVRREIQERPGASRPRSP